MRARRRIWLPAAASAVLLVGCGGSHPRASPSAHVLFGEACGACHSVSGSSSPRQQGGDLLRFRASRTQFLQLAREMPVRRHLTDTELRAVVSYLIGIERHPPPVLTPSQ
jgi:mono/diheme cytochrome c family protein